MRSQIRTDPLGRIHFLRNSLKMFLVLGHGVEVVANDGSESGIDVEDGLFEGQAVAVHVHLPLPGSQATEQEEAVFFLGWHLDRLLGQAHRL